MSDEERNIYCARLPGWPGFVAVMVDEPRFKKETAKELAEWVKHGYDIAGKFTRAESVEGLKEFAAEQDRRKSEPPAPKADGPQMALFA